MVRVTRASAHASKEASVELAMFLAIHAILAPMAPLTSTGHVPDDCASLAVSADTQLISKAHIFSTARGFRAEPRNLGFFPRGIDQRNFTAEFVFSAVNRGI